MKKISPFCILFMLMVLLQGCVKNEFALDFKLDASVSTTLRMVYYASDSKTGWYMDQVAPVEKGVCESKCVTRNPTLVFLFLSSAKDPSLIVYAERGDRIEITGKGADPRGWSVGGNEINEDWTEWRLANLAALQSNDPAKINAAVEAYVNKNRDSELSALLLLTAFSRRHDEKLFSRLWNSLSEKARPEELVGLVGRSDRLSAGELGKAPDLGVLRLHVYGDSLVEMKPSAAKATFLLFSRETDAGAGIIADSMKNLISRYAGQNFARISFDSNSYSWSRLAREDSLENALYAWMPRAEASPEAMRLEVARTPWIVVADSKGTIAYRGDDASKAASAFRNIMNKK